MKGTAATGKGLASAAAALQPGRAVALRELIRGKVWTATPATVVEDGPSLLALFTPAGARCKRPALADGGPLRLPQGDWILREESWSLDTLRLFTPGALHSVQLHWSSNPRRLLRWYINLEDPLRQSAVGFDGCDHIVDIVVSPDRKTWEWKDLDELEEARKLDLVGADEIARRVAEGERALARVRAGVPPFGSSWERWRPDPRWAVPTLPAGWQLGS